MQSFRSSIGIYTEQSLLNDYENERIKYETVASDMISFVEMQNDSTKDDKEAVQLLSLITKWKQLKKDHMIKTLKERSNTIQNQRVKLKLLKWLDIWKDYVDC